MKQFTSQSYTGMSDEKNDAAAPAEEVVEEAEEKEAEQSTRPPQRGLLVIPLTITNTCNSLISYESI